VQRASFPSSSACGAGTLGVTGGPETICRPAARAAARRTKSGGCPAEVVDQAPTREPGHWVAARERAP